MLKVTGSMQKSTEVMKLTNELVKLPQLNAAMRQMSMEMMKVSRAGIPCVLTHPTDKEELTRSLACHLHAQAGILEEMMDETLDGLDEDQDELEDEADAEVDKVLFDLTDGKLGVLTGKVGSTLPVRPLCSPCFPFSRRISSPSGAVTRADFRRLTHSAPRWDRRRSLSRPRRSRRKSSSACSASFRTSSTARRANVPSSGRTPQAEPIASGRAAARSTPLVASDRARAEWAQGLGLVACVLGGGRPYGVGCPPPLDGHGR